MDNLILEKSKAFAIRGVKLYQYLNDEKHEFVLSKQLLRSSTSIGANCREASRAQSSADFIAKLNYCTQGSRRNSILAGTAERNRLYR